MGGVKQIKLGAILSYISIAVNIITGLVYIPWMVGVIGQSQYGLYTLANSVITLFLVDFGLSSATGRYLSKYHAEGDRDGAERFLGAIYKLYLLIDAVILTILLLIFLLLDRIFVNLTAAELEQLRVVYAVAALFNVINFPFVTFNGILTAYEKFVPLKLADLLYRLGNVGFTVLALMLGCGLYALVIVHTSVGLLVLVFKYTVIKKTIPVKADFRKNGKELYLSIFGFSVWVTASMLASRLVFNNSNILNLMNRRGNGEYLRWLFKTLREKVPGLVLRTSVITGLPGEGEEEFAELCEFLKDVKLERVGAFPFSPEEGTPAAEMDHVDSDTAMERAEQVEILQSRIMDAFNASWIGKEVEVLVDGYDEEYEQFYGRTYADSPDIDGRVWIACQEPLTEGEFVRVYIEDTVDGDLTGFLVEE